MKIHEVSTNQITVKSKVRKNQNLTSFGTNQPTPTEQPTGDDKKASEAIKNNFLANVSFSGHSKQFNVVRADEHYIEEYNEPIYIGSSGQISGYERKTRIKGLKSTEYIVDYKYRSSDADTAIRRAITMSDDYQGGEIKANGNFEIAYHYPAYFIPSNSKKADVYFADKGEAVQGHIIAHHDYVVYPKGSYESSYNNTDTTDFDDGNPFGSCGGWTFYG